MAFEIDSRRCRRKDCEYCASLEAQPPSVIWEDNSAKIKDMMKAISENCLIHENKITVRTPILEAVFLLLLSNANRPMSVQELQNNIMEMWGTQSYLRNISKDSFEGVLQATNPYFIRRRGK